MADSKETRKAKAAAAKAAAAARARAHRERLRSTRTVRHFGGFLEFMRQQGIAGLAIGLVLGTQAKSLVDAFVASFITPLVGLLLPGTETLADKKFVLTLGSKSEEFKYGPFVEALISFIIIA